MFRPCKTLAATALSIVVLVGPSASQDESADLVLVNGIVHTVDRDRPRAQAIAIRGDRILAVGNNREVRRLMTPATDLVDLKGKFVLPGFVDSHTHFEDAGARLLGANLLRVHDEAGLVEELTQAVLRHPKGSWILGGSWGAYEQWDAGAAGNGGRASAERFLPHKSMIDPVSLSHPVLLSRFDGEVHLANSLALSRAGIDAATEDPEDGVIERDGNGEPTGILRGSAVDKIRALLAEKSWEQRLGEARHALAELRRHGVTSIHDVTSRDQLRVFQRLLQNQELTVRVWARPSLELVEHLAAVGIETGFGNDFLKIGGVKGSIDGAIADSTALLFEPYEHQPETSGRLQDMMMPEGNMLRLLRAADRARLVPSVHAIGDRAVALLLDLYEQIVEENPPWARRLRISHSQIIRREDFQRFGELGVIAEVQPFHAVDDIRWTERRIGNGRASRSFAYRSLQDGGALLCFGTDWPGTHASYYPVNPLLSIYAATTRKTLSGEPKGGWFFEQTMTIADAIEAYTMGSAFSAYEEMDKGSIAPGKLADLIVLSKDITAIPAIEIKDVDVLMTYLGGKLIFEHDAE